MQRLRFSGIALLVPALAMLVVGSGCSGDTKDKPPAKSGGGDAGKSASAKSGDKTALASTGVATIKGKVTYDGDPPPSSDLKAAMQAVKDEKERDHCLKGDTENPTWMIGADKSVKNVVVWLKPADGHYFNITGDAAKPAEQEVTIDQPFCAFKPHVVALYPSYWDPETKAQKKTGQVFKVLNSAPINHNTAWKGKALLNDGKNEILKPKGEMVVNAKPCRDNQSSGEDVININCDIHKWMTAKALVFDHPYFAITKDDGSFEIKNVPAGAEISIVSWHEDANQGAPEADKGYGLPEGKGNRKGMAVTLKDGETKELNFKVKK
jgi:hypothetical protein